MTKPPYVSAVEWIDNYRKEKERAMREFETGATRDSDDGKLDYDGFLSPYAIARFAEYMHKHRKQADGEMRASDNWQKGIPLGAYMKSMWRHFMEVWSLHRGVGREHIVLYENDDDFLDLMSELLCALKFNVDGYLHEIEKSRAVRDNESTNIFKQSDTKPAPHIEAQARPEQNQTWAAR